MAHRVRIFLRHGNETTGRYVGERDLPKAPGLDGSIAFEHDGRVKTGKVERVVPTDWRPDSGPRGRRVEKAPPKRG
jgi:hypothetical protein